MSFDRNVAAQSSKRAMLIVFMGATLVCKISFYDLPFVVGEEALKTTRNFVVELDAHNAG